MKSLTVTNFAVVEHLDLEFGAGLNVFSGETGAGKSILIEALGLTLGDRADAGKLRAGAERADITAVFDVSANAEAAALLAEHGLEIDDKGEDECILRRQINADGRSRAFCNAQPVPVQVLKSLGETLVDIHGQHAHQSLTKRATQRDLLDTFGNHQGEVKRVAQAYAAWSALDKRLAELAGETSDFASRLELLRFQVEELEADVTDVAAIEALEQNHARLANATRLIDDAASAVDCLDDDGAGALHNVDKALALLEGLSRLDGSFEGTATLLGEARINLAEALGSLRDSVDDLVVDPAQLDETERALDSLQRLARKHRVDRLELPARLAELRERLAELENLDSTVATLEADRDAAAAAYTKHAKALSKARAKSAARMSKAITALMHTLGMPNGTFEVAVAAGERDRPGPGGSDAIAFNVSANPGQPPRPLARIASGGELSRISLAIQVATAGHTGVPVLVYDEVDAGIGGGVAEIVGQRLAELAASRQLLCITHLPQIACFGATHFVVGKRQQASSTSTWIEKLAGDERTIEIARMLGGLDITDTTIDHAREMLEKSCR